MRPGRGSLRSDEIVLAERGGGGLVVLEGIGEGRSGWVLRGEVDEYDKEDDEDSEEGGDAPSGTGLRELVLAPEAWRRGWNVEEELGREGGW